MNKLFLFFILSCFIGIIFCHPAACARGNILEVSVDEEDPTVLEDDLLEVDVLGSTLNCDPQRTCIYRCPAHTGCHKGYAFDVSHIPGWHCARQSFHSWLLAEAKKEERSVGYVGGFHNAMWSIFSRVWDDYKRICHGQSFAITYQAKNYIWNNMMSNHYMRTNYRIQQAAIRIFGQFYWRANHGIFNLCDCDWRLQNYRHVADNMCRQCRG